VCVLGVCAWGGEEASSRRSHYLVCGCSGAHRHSRLGLGLECLNRRGGLRACRPAGWDEQACNRQLCCLQTCTWDRPDRGPPPLTFTQARRLPPLLPSSKFDLMVRGSMDLTGSSSAEPNVA